MSLTCPSCGNEKNFQVKTLQLHLLQVEGTGVDVSEESRPALLELLCDECETEVDFQTLDGDLRQEILQKID